MQYQRGSEWRRWDLHIHTPMTAKNDNFEGSSVEEKWNKFYDDIITYVSSPELCKKVAVIGITDYLSVDNYRKVISDKKITDKFQLILPNVELRITPTSTKSLINIHCIFNPDFVSQIDSKFFSKLKFKHKGKDYYAIREDIVALGKANDSSLDDNKAYEKGVSQFVVSKENLEEIFADAQIRENVIIVLANGSNDGVSGLGNLSKNNAISDLTMLREELVYFSDLIFTGTTGDISHYLGKGALSKGDIIKKYGKLKACIHGSDAHENSKLFEPSMQKYCWIKADCTWNGFKQVIYEPEDRVNIGSILPDLKQDYNIIDKIIINDSKFSPMPIYLNPNLTCFIGGKSTGKSILLNNIAKTIDRDQYEEKIEQIGTRHFNIEGLKVYWKDGEISEQDKPKRNIVYIPQTYLNRLSDNVEEFNEIDKLIEKIILQDENILNEYQSYKEKLSKLKYDIDTNIYQMLQLLHKINELENRKAEYSSEDLLKKEIQKLKKERELLIKSLDIKDTDFNLLEQIRQELIKNNEKIEYLVNQKNILEETNSPIVSCLELAFFSQEYKDALNLGIGNILSQANESWLSLKTEVINDISISIDQVSKTISEEIEKRDELTPKIDKSESIKDYSAKIEKEENRLMIVHKLNQELSEATLQFKQNKELLENLTLQFKVIHDSFATYVNNKANTSDLDIEFVALAAFRTESYVSKIFEMFNKRKLVNVYDFESGFSPNDYDVALVEKLSSYLINSSQELVLKKNKTIEEVLRVIFADWYNVTYTVKMDNDNIEQMSPGKKALVLLKLIINLAEADCPILIDQPEDDLDNRSIFDELVGFIRSRKNKRQIILVTHNANIVLGADAEEIIVANQDGNSTPNCDYRFEYRSGSIENNSLELDDQGKVKNGVLCARGIQDHICEILEGGKEAFNIRKNKYTLIKQ